MLCLDKTKLLSFHTVPSAVSVIRNFIIYIKMEASYIKKPDHKYESHFWGNLFMQFILSAICLSFLSAVCFVWADILLWGVV